MTQLQLGDRAPDTTFEGPDGSLVPMQSLIGSRALVLYFYPKDFTAGCTAESCAFRDAYEDFLAAGADVVGVSNDPPESHDRFRQRYRLPFRLLSDPGGKARAAFGVTKTLGLIEGRVTFVFDRQGVLRHRFSSQLQTQAHVSEALKVVLALA